MKSQVFSFVDHKFDLAVQSQIRDFVWGENAYIMQSKVNRDYSWHADADKPLNISCAELFEETQTCICILYHSSIFNDGWNLSSMKTRRTYFTIKIMAPDGLSTQIARASTLTILT